MICPHCKQELRWIEWTPSCPEGMWSHWPIPSGFYSRSSCDINEQALAELRKFQ